MTRNNRLENIVTHKIYCKKYHYPQKGKVDQKVKITGKFYVKAKTYLAVKKFIRNSKNQSKFDM